MATTSLLGLSLKAVEIARAAEPATGAGRAAKSEVKTAGIRLVPVDGKYKVSVEAKKFLEATLSSYS